MKQDFPVELTPKWVKNKLPKRPQDANKGTFGKVLMVVGSENYPGAAYLCAAAAYRIGAGLVSLATGDVVKIIVSQKLPEVTFIPISQVLSQIDNFDVLLLGPGLGQDQDTENFFRRLLKNHHLPITIIDGDCLNLLSKIENFWDQLSEDVILTPHPKELSRLCHLSVAYIQQHREKVAYDFSKKWGLTIVLKGANTVIASPKTAVLISPFANPLLATAGTGDILSGIIAGLAAQGLAPFDAAAVGVYIHGLAGEILKKDLGNAGLLASDLLAVLPKALKETQ